MNLFWTTHLFKISDTLLHQLSSQHISLTYSVPLSYQLLENLSNLTPPEVSSTKWVHHTPGIFSTYWVSVINQSFVFSKYWVPLLNQSLPQHSEHHTPPVVSQKLWLPLLNQLSKVTEYRYSTSRLLNIYWRIEHPYSTSRLLNTYWLIEYPPRKNILDFVLLAIFPGVSSPWNSWREENISAAPPPPPPPPPPLQPKPNAREKESTKDRKKTKRCSK